MLNLNGVNNENRKQTIYALNDVCLHTHFFTFYAKAHTYSRNGMLQLKMQTEKAYFKKL